MRRLRALIPVLALVAAACGGGSDVVATVDGDAILYDDVQGLQFDASTELSNEEFGQLLDVLIAWKVFTSEAASEFGIESTDDEVQARVRQILAASGVPDRESFLQSQNISLAGLERTVVQFLIEEGLSVALAPGVADPDSDEVAALLAAEPAEFTEVCLVHILVETAAEADEVVNLLVSGSDFGELASLRSQDPESAAAGGNLGCAQAADFIPEFASASLTAEVGQVTGPVETSFGFHVLRVESRNAPSLADVADAFRASAIADAIDAWYVRVLDSVEVTVDSRYGVWQSGGISQLVPGDE